MSLSPNHAMSLLLGKQQLMGLFQKSLLLWFLFAGLHLVLTRLCEWQQELDEGDEEEVFFRLLSRVAPLRLASQGLCVV